MNLFKKPVFLLVISVASIYFLIILDAQKRRTALSEQEKAKAVSSLSQAYIRGFSAGVQSALDHIEFNTNTGKFQLELTNVFPDMKP